MSTSIEGQLDECEKTFGRKDRTGIAGYSTVHQTQARCRATEFKLESLEERILLSTSHLPHPAFTLPIGLGQAYAALSMQAHGLGLDTNSHRTMPWDDHHDVPGDHGGPGCIPEEIDSYPAHDHGGGRGQEPELALHRGIGEDDGPFGEEDNPQEEAFGRFAPNILTDPGNYLQLLARHPELTGLTRPPLLPTVLTGFDGMNFSTR